MGYAIDVSHFQNPATLPWDSQFAGKVNAVIARAGYGSELRDKHCREHIRRARGIRAKVGLYLFYRPTQPVRKQFDLLCSVADAVLLGPGDIVPTLDVEKDPFPKPGIEVSRDWLGPVEELVGLIDDRFATKCMIYITRREFNALGAPAWMLEPDRPIWVAHYTEAAKPATPGGREVVMWQHRVGPFVHNGPGGYVENRPDLDQNRILGTLPLLGAQPAVATPIVETLDDQAEDFDDYDDARIRELTLTGEELDALDAEEREKADTEPPHAPATQRDPAVRT